MKFNKFKVIIGEFIIIFCCVFPALNEQPFIVVAGQDGATLSALYAVFLSRVWQKKCVILYEMNICFEGKLNSTTAKQ